MVVFITLNIEGLSNVFIGENHIDCPGLHCTGLYCTWFTRDTKYVIISCWKQWTLVSQFYYESHVKQL